MDALANRRRFWIRVDRRVNRIPYLPEEIIEKILVRLPVKSLIRFKCVSKSWCLLINDRLFIKAQISKSLADPSFTNLKVITNDDLVQQWSLLSLLHEPCPIMPVEYYYPTYVNARADFVGCCDGLVCILIDCIDFILWNPATKEFNLLPSVVSNGVGFVMYGFGYDELSDDYKVFGLVGRSNSKKVVKVYSLKTDSWKTVDEDIPFEIELPIILCGKFLCGKLHWIGTTVSEPKTKWEVSSFDLENECYGSLELPHRADGDFVPSVGVLEGSLCLLCDHAMAQTFDVWIMKEYNVRDSWHKMATLPYPKPCDYLFLDPLFVGGGGEILFVCDDSSFVVYHPRDSRFSHPRLIDFEEFESAHVYVESLISPVPVVQNSRTADEMMKIRRIVESEFE